MEYHEELSAHGYVLLVDVIPARNLPSLLNALLGVAAYLCGGYFAAGVAL